MNSLKDVLSALGGDFAVSSLFLLVFGALSIYSFEALVNHILLEMEARKGYDERKLVLEKWFGNYNDRVQELMEMARLREEARRAREMEQ